MINLPSFETLLIRAEAQVDQDRAEALDTGKCMRCHTADLDRKVFVNPDDPSETRVSPLCPACRKIIVDLMLARIEARKKT